MARTGRPVARGIKLTPERQEKMVQAISMGTPFITACRYVGINPDTGFEWLRKGEYPAKAPIYANFADAIAQARAQDEMRRIGRIEQAGRGGAVIYRKTTTYADGRMVTEERTAPPDWEADSWHLERSQPDVWGRRERLDVRLSIDQAAEKVAAELGLTKAEVLAEATALLYELDTARAPMLRLLPPAPAQDLPA